MVQKEIKKTVGPASTGQGMPGLGETLLTQPLDCHRLVTLDKQPGVSSKHSQFVSSHGTMVHGLAAGQTCLWRK